jgi:hypothetical protein
LVSSPGTACRRALATPRLALFIPLGRRARSTEGPESKSPEPAVVLSGECPVAVIRKATERRPGRSQAGATSRSLTPAMSVVHNGSAKADRRQTKNLASARGIALRPPPNGRTIPRSGPASISQTTYDGGRRAGRVGTTCQGTAARGKPLLSSPTGHRWGPSCRPTAPLHASPAFASAAHFSPATSPFYPGIS